MKEFYELLWKNTEPVSAQINNILADGNYCIITGDFSTRMLPTGKILNSFFCIQVTIENNLIIKYSLLEDRYAVSMSLTSSNK